MAKKMPMSFSVNSACFNPRVSAYNRGIEVTALIWMSLTSFPRMSADFADFSFCPSIRVHLRVSAEKKRASSFRPPQRPRQDRHAGGDTVPHFVHDHSLRAIGDRSRQFEAADDGAR